MMKTLRLLFMATVLFCVADSSAQGIVGLIERLDELEEKVNALESSVVAGGAAGADLAPLESSLRNLRARLATLSENVAAGFEARAATTDPAPQESALAEMRLQLETVGSEIDGLRAELAELGADEVASATVDEDCADDLRVSGFVDASFFYDGSTEDNTFGLDQAEVDIEKSIGATGAVRLDLEYVSDGEGGFALDAEQGYVVFAPVWLGGLDLTFGKFNAPIGFELLDAPDMYQYSHALVFDNGLPTNLSGAMFTTSFGEGFDLAAYVCNGWDQNVDVNHGKNFGGRLGYNNDAVATGLSLISGTQDADSEDKLTVVDWDFGITPREWWTVGAEVNIGSNEVADESLGWWGFLLMSHWDFNSSYGATIRFDYFDDKDALRLDGGMAQKRKAIAIAPTFALGDGMGALIELRFDFSDEDVFTDVDGEATGSAFCAAWEMTYCF